MKRMADYPEPVPEFGWTLVFASILAAIFAVLVVAGIFAIGQP